jgi:hypothetical protein
VLNIHPVTSQSRQRQFIELPFQLYADDPHFVPPLRRDEWHRFSPAHNPFLEHGTIDSWVAESNGRIVGRVAAIDDRRYRERHGHAIGWFGFFEAADATVASQLLDRVERHHREQGRSVIQGPVNPSLNESAGVLIDAFDRDPYLLMPYNPAVYASFIEAAGYRKAKDLLAWTVDVAAGPSGRVVRIAQRAARRHGVVVRALDVRHFERDLAIVQQIYALAWQDNWGFVPPTDREITQLVTDLRPIIDPALVLFAEIGGKPVGCSVALPDANQVLKRMKGRLLPFGFLHFLRRRTIITQVRLLLLGVVPEARHIGLYPMLMYEQFQRTKARGYRGAEMSWTLEDNDGINAGIEAIGGRRYKTYRVYEKSIG